MRRISFVFALALVAARVLTGCGPGTKVDGLPDGDLGVADLRPPDLAPPPGPLKPFPDKFLWGASTAPYAVEGGLINSDWSQWEKSAANTTAARSADGPRSDLHFDEDGKAAAEMHHNAMRLGIDMSRLFPTQDSFPGRPDAAAVKLYHDIFKSLKTRGIQPIVTLHDRAFPQWIQDLDRLTDVSGWQGEGIANTFAAFAGWAGREYGAEVDIWVTIDEPMANVLLGYVRGEHPPLFKSDGPGGVERALKVFRNLARAHARAFDALVAADVADADADGRPALVGVALSNRPFSGYPASDNAGKTDNDLAAMRLARQWNQAFPSAIVRGDLDGNLDGDLDDKEDKKADPDLKARAHFLGASYDGPSMGKALGGSPSPFGGHIESAALPTANAKTEQGMDIDPAGLRAVLDELAAFGLPLYITGNGLADAKDGMRPRFLALHLYHAQKALADGLDVRGYFHASLIDHLAFSAGFCPRRGLYAVDFAAPNRTRSARASAALMREIIDAKAVDPSLFDKHPSYAPPAMTCKGAF